MSIDLLLVNSPTDDYENVDRNPYYTLPPIGLGSIATFCEDRGFSVNLLDAEYLGLAVGEIIKHTIGLEPRFFGINLLPTNYSLVKKIIDGVLAESAAKIILGGPYCTIRHKEILEENHLIFGLVRGEGEIPVHNLLRNISRKSIPGVSYIDNGELILKDLFHLSDLDAIPHVNRNFLTNDPHTSESNRESVIFTSRGCPYKCIYCAANQVAGQKVRFRSISNVIDEVNELQAEFGVDSIYILDDLFFLNPDRVRQFAKEILERKIIIRWKALARADNLTQNFDDNLMRLVAESGCWQITFGIESGSDRIQKHIKKNLDLQMVKHAIKLCSRSGIQTKSYFMLGFPSETKAEMLETINFALDCELDQAFFVGVRAFPGTDLYDSLRKNGVPSDTLDNYYQLSNLIDDPLTRNGLRSKGIDPDSLVKYNVLNKSSITTISNDELVSVIRYAYQQFYS